MGLTVGRNVNRNTETTQSIVSLNSTTATKIADKNLARIYFSICLNCSVSPACVFIKLQAALVDNLKVGEILFRNFTGNDNAFQMRWEMSPDNIYNGEISAISELGNVDIHVTEY